MQKLRKRIHIGRKLIQSIKSKLKKKEIMKRRMSLKTLIVVYACKKCISQPSFFADIHFARPVFRDMLIQNRTAHSIRSQQAEKVLSSRTDLQKMQQKFQKIRTKRKKMYKRPRFDSLLEIQFMKLQLLYSIFEKRQVMDIESVSSQPLHLKINIEHLLKEQIGFGSAQYKLCRPISLLLFSEGCESIVLGLLLPILTRQWDLTAYQLSTLITCVYLGVGLGSYLQSFSDRYGRKIFITWNIILQSVFGLLSCICWSFSSYLFVRFFYGVALGICLPLSGTYISEIAPPEGRVKLLMYTRYYFSSGALFTCALGWCLLASNSWRMLLFIICLPGIYAFYDQYKQGRESLKFLWIHKREEEVLEMISFMCKQNGKVMIDGERIKGMLCMEEDYEKGEDVSFMDLMSQKYSRCTWRLTLCWFVVMFIYYGILLLLPSILQSLFSPANSYNFKYLFLFLVTAVEVSCYKLCAYLLDHPKVGRKKSVYYGALSTCFLFVLVILIGKQHPVILLILFLIIKFTIILMFMALYPYTTEIYETKYRAKAMGVGSLSGRFGVIFLGMIGVHAISWLNGNGLYVLFVAASGLGSIAAATMPYCTLNRLIQ